MANRNPYKFYTQKLADGRIKTIAVSTYAGRTVRGSAICDLADTYDPAVGQEIAATRCAAKVAQRRLNRATRKQREAQAAVAQAQRHFLKMAAYYNDAVAAQADAARAANAILH